MLGRFSTGGRGTGETRLSSQGSVTLSEDGRHLFVVNVGSDELSVFRVVNGGLHLIDVVPSGGDEPYSVTVRGSLVYVLNNGGERVGNITGFRQSRDGTLRHLPDSTRLLSGAATDPAQVSFSPDGGALVVTEKATNRLDVFPVRRGGLAGNRRQISSPGVTPFGFEFTRDGELVVTEAQLGETGEATASSYCLTDDSRLRILSSAVADRRTEVCWTVITKDQRFAYVTNFGDGTISSYRVASDGRISLRDPVAATTTPGELSVRDEKLSADGRFLYAIDITSQKVHAWRVETNGALNPLGAFPGLPRTVAGMAAS